MSFVSFGRRHFAKLLAGGAALGALPVLARLRPGSGAGSESASTSASSGKSAPPPSPKLGINLAGPADWNTELPFVDVFRLSRAWSVQREDGPPPPASVLELDADGWVKKMPEGTWVETPLCGTGSVERAPQGEWTVLYQGRGEIEMWGELETIARQANRLVFRTKPGAAGGFFLRIKRSDPADHVRDVRVLMPGHAQTHRTEPWNPSLIRRWQGMACLRFMDLQETNNSKQVRWSDRPRPEHSTFAERGVAPELLVDLANRLRSDAWLCIPHGADDGYVRSYAELVRQRLQAPLRVYLEYSNEIWNSMFGQHAHARERGRALKLAGSDFEAAMAYNARRSREIFAIWSDVFQDTGRLVRVIGSQHASPDATRLILSDRKLRGQADVLAVAPYLALSPAPQGAEGPSTREVRGWSLERVFRHLEQVELPALISRLAAQQKLASAQGLKVVAYEGGQHLVGILGGENDEAVTSLFLKANRDPRMGALYARMYQAWQAGGGDLFCHFSSVSRWSKWGSWGLLEQHDENPATSPKFVESMRWARSLGQKVGGSG